MAVIDTVTNATNGASIDIVDERNVGFGSLTAEDFLKMLVVQLQNQDPTEPTSNEALLSQLSEMRNLQASIDQESFVSQMIESQTNLASASFASSSASLIGRTITASVTDPETEESTLVDGVVDRALLKDGKAYVGIGTQEVPVDEILSVRSTEETEGEVPSINNF